MATTNHTTNYELSQYIGTDITSYMTNYNGDMTKIDAQMKTNADAAASAASDASTAVSTANTAASNASTALSTANAANTAAESAQTAAQSAQTSAGAAVTTANAALAASASNTIGNLAPAYDATLTYEVDDLVTYVDPETNQGKLYKCIIAIGTPEAFNINKWDDVTTSEVYAPKPLELLFEHDGVKTSSELYVEARAAIIAIPNYRFKKIDIYTGVGSQYGTQMHLSAIDSVDENPTLYFNAGTCSANSATIRNMLITSSATQGCSIVLNSSGNTVTTTDYTQVATSDIKVTVV